MTGQPSLSEQLEHASTRLLQERTKAWHSFDECEQTKQLLLTYQTRFSQPNTSGLLKPLENGVPNVELASAVRALATSAQQITQLDLQIAQVATQLRDLEARAKQFWIWLMLIALVVIAAVTYVLLPQ